MSDNKADADMIIIDDIEIESSSMSHSEIIAWWTRAMPLRTRAKVEKQPDGSILLVIRPTEPELATLKL